MSFNLFSQRAGAFQAPRSKLFGVNDMPSSAPHTQSASASNRNSVPSDRLKLTVMSSSSSTSDGDNDTIMGDITPSMTEEGTTSDTQTENETPPDSPEDEVPGKKESLQQQQIIPVGHQPRRPILPTTFGSFRSVSLASVDTEAEEKAYEGEGECDGGSINRKPQREQGTPPDPLKTVTPKRPVSLARLRTSSLVLPKRYQQENNNPHSPAGTKRVLPPPRLDLRGTSFIPPQATTKRAGLGLGLPSPINPLVISGGSSGGQSSPEEEGHHNHSPRFRSATAPAPVPVFRVPPTPVLRPMPFATPPISPLDLGAGRVGFRFCYHDQTQSLGDYDDDGCNGGGGRRGRMTDEGFSSFSDTYSCRRVVSLTQAGTGVPLPSNESSATATAESHPPIYPLEIITSHIQAHTTTTAQPERILIRTNGPPPPIPPRDRRRPISITPCVSVSVSDVLSRRRVVTPLASSSSSGNSRLIEHPHFGSEIRQSSNLRVDRGDGIGIGIDAVPRIEISVEPPP